MRADSRVTLPDPAPVVVRPVFLAAEAVLEACEVVLVALVLQPATNVEGQTTTLGIAKHKP